MTRNRIAAVIPTYNYGRFVTEAVDSVLAQTYGRMPVIVVDDGSTDDTAERLEPYRDRITYIFQENQGISAARNAGIRHADAEWVALLDADDRWHPKKIVLQLRAAEQFPEAALVGAPIGAEMPDQLDANPRATPLSVRDFLIASPVGPSGVLIRRACLDQVGMFDPALGSCEDRDLWLRLAARFPTVRVESPCWSYRLHPGQMTRNSMKIFHDYERMLARFFAAHPEHAPLRPAATACLYADAAVSLLAEGKRHEARRFLLRSLSACPWARSPDAFSTRRRVKLLIRCCLGETLFHRARSLPLFSCTERIPC